VGADVSASSLDARLARAADVALGLSIASWGVIGLWRAAPEERLCVARLTLTALDLVVGVLVLRRAPLIVRARWLELAAGVPSFLAGGVAMSLARPLSAWPPLAAALFALGGAGVLASLVALGRCFAILPGARGVVARGPYRLVRHPAYLCEIVMLGGAALALGLPLGPALLVAGALLVALRIAAEESPLRQLEAYRTYVARVRFRLVPGVW
jgi:protein-S-isoprenylcysteine O-methyltransferase Ste14